MPRVAKELSALDVKRLSHPGDKGNVTFAVGGVSGLLMQITPGGAKMWILRAAIGAKRREIGLGGYPDVTLAQARDRAREARDMIWRGVDPIEDRKARRAAVTAAQLRGKTFAQAIDGYCKAKLEEIGNEKDRKRWRSAVERFTLPHIGNLLVNDLTVQDMLRVLEPIWIEKTESARKLRSRIENIIAWATVAGHRTGENPARWKGNLDTLLPKPGKIADKKNHPAIALGDVVAWSAALRERKGTAARALEFLLLCASRSGEVRGATWDEVDLQARIWTIPAERMKAEREHRIPLTDRAIEIIEAMPRLGESPFIFAAPREGMLSDMTLSAVMRRMQADAEDEASRAGLPAEKAGWRDARSGVPAVPHGLRSTFRDWAAERTGFPREMAEIALAHSVGSEVERAYRRSDMIEKRRAMMAAWADFLTGEGPAGNNVVRIG